MRLLRTIEDIDLTGQERAALNKLTMLTLFLFTDHGNCLAAALRPGNIHSADDWDELLVPVVRHQMPRGSPGSAAPRHTDSAWRHSRVDHRRGPSRAEFSRAGV